MAVVQTSSENGQQLMSTNLVFLLLKVWLMEDVEARVEVPALEAELPVVKICSKYRPKLSRQICILRIIRWYRRKL